MLVGIDLMTAVSHCANRIRGVYSGSIGEEFATFELRFVFAKRIQSRHTRIICFITILLVVVHELFVSGNAHYALIIL